MNLIDDFLKEYNKQYDFFSKVARIGSRQIEEKLSDSGIKAITSYRAKSPQRLKDKLYQRSEEKQYKSIKDIFDDIIDLAGVRIALYFPDDRELVDGIVKNLFIIKKKKTFPLASHSPEFKKRFSGYWATHYRVVLKPEKNGTSRYIDTIFEIQVASVLMHAWSEVEHDLVYKPLSGGLSDEELAILDQINGLVMSGEIALELLQKAMLKRTKSSNDFTDNYEVKNLIVNSLGKNYLSKLKLGNTKLISNYFKTVDKADTDYMIKFLANVSQSANETISDQLLNMLLNDSLKNDVNEKSLQKYFNKISGSQHDTSGFEQFVKTWIVLEKATNKFNQEKNKTRRKYFVPKFEVFLDEKILNKKEVYNLNHFRMVRNQLLHGVETPPDEYLNNAYLRLKETTLKIIKAIEDVEIKNDLIDELNSLNIQNNTEI